LWVNDERSVDKFHVLDKQLYQVMLNHEESGTLNTQEDTQAILAAALEAEVPQVEMAIQSTPSFWFGEMPLTANEKTIKSLGKFSDKNYFKLFSFPIVYGSPDKVLENPDQIVISESLAINLFGNASDAIGQVIEWQLIQFKKNLTVSGVFEDVPANSTEEFDFVVSFDIFRGIIGDGGHWGNYNALTYALLKENTDVEALNTKLAGYIKEKLPDSNVSLFFRPYADKYLYSKYENGVQSGGRIEYVRLFSIISIFILLIACINFMNLSTAKASRRIKEVGVKKAIGANRGALILQYLEESFLMTFISIVTALVLVWGFLPQFNQLTGKSISLLINGELAIALIATLLITSIVAGSYPAFYLSGFKAATILKGKMKSSLGELWARKGLVVFQFALSVILIVSVVIVGQQIAYVQSTNIGYDKENLILFANEGGVNENHVTFIDQLKNTPGVVNASSTSHTIINGGSYTTGVEWPNKNKDVQVRFANVEAYYNFIETLGLELIQGRTFSKEFSNETEKLIFNEKAIELMGITDPIGKKVSLWGNDVEIIGVVKDFNFESLHDEVTPQFFRFSPNFLTTIVVRMEAGQTTATLARVEELYKSYNADFNFDFKFLDQEYNKLYASEMKVSMLSRYFGGIAIIISCLGLFGLAAFTAERRFKEIGVRKALGASSISIIRLLSMDFNKMIGLAILIALPISYYFISTWLEAFAYKIDLKIWYFLGSGGLALLIAWLTVAIQTFKAARINPAQSLRSE
jgi:ABC-type antimicrobial peptide transport system permease subunit